MSDQALQYAGRTLIIGGATRCGTTSLFLYLAAHPAICRSNVKETRFFLEEAYPLDRRVSLREGIQEYERYFEHCTPGEVSMEATPDYLYSAHAARSIRVSLAYVRIVFLLRDPIERLISWYRYGRQRGLLDPSVTLESYVQASLEDKFPFRASPQVRLALKQGRYSNYLRAYTALFDPAELFVCNYDVLRADPASIVLNLCQRLGLSAEPYDTFVFRVHNPSATQRWPLLNRISSNVVGKMRSVVRGHPMIRDSLRAFKRSMEDMVGLYGRSQSERPSLSKETYDRLSAYYRDEPHQLAELLGLDSWEWQRSVDFELTEP